MSTDAIFDRCHALLQDLDQSAQRRVTPGLTRVPPHASDQEESYQPAAELGVHYLLRWAGDPGRRDVISGPRSLRRVALAVELVHYCGGEIAVDSAQFAEVSRVLSQTWEGVRDALEHPGNLARQTTGWIQSLDFRAPGGAQVRGDRVVAVGTFVAEYDREMGAFV